MKHFLLVLWLLSATQIYAQVFPTEVLLEHGSVGSRINILLMGDGYTAEEQGDFKSDAQHVVDKLFLESPYKEYANFFNAAIIKVPSVESGTDHPANATDVNEPVFPQGVKNTYFNTTFDGWQIHRLVITNNTGAAYSVAATNYPSYDQILMIVNHNEYGGSGGDIATFSTHPTSAEIGIHEMGHSFSALADEYWAGDQYAQERPNMTKTTDENTVKWHNWMNTNGIGIYQHCCGGTSSTWYRPHQSCKMRQLGDPFCSVCKEQTIDRIYQLVTPISSFSPNNAVQNYTTGTLDFSVDLILPVPNTLKLKWTLDGQVVGTNVSNVQLSDFPEGNSTVTLTVSDTTMLSRKNPLGYVFTQSWTVNNAVAVAEPSTKLFYKIYPNPTTDRLYVEIGGDFPEKETLVELVAPSGQVVFSERKLLMQKSVLEFSVANFPKGHYFLKITRGELVQSVPVVVE